MAITSVPTVFDETHYASGWWQKLKRSLQLGPRYYSRDLPRYLRNRRALDLPLWDMQAFVNPFREFHSRTYAAFPLPPRYDEALARLFAAGVRLTMPRGRLEALVGAWWSVREVNGDCIECGAYRGATSLLIAWLGKQHGLSQKVLMLDTFRGIPDTSNFDVSRNRGEFMPPDDQAELVVRQAAALGITDQIEVHAGLFADTFAELRRKPLRFAFVHIDANIYQGTWESCDFTIPRVATGGAIVFDDYNGVCDLGARLAIDKYLLARRKNLVPLAGSSAMLRI